MTAEATRLWFDSALTADGWARDVRVEIVDGRIGVLATGAPPTDAPTFGAAVPGLPNLHSHAFQRALAGLTEARGADDDSFWTWREVMFRFVGRLDPEAVEAIAALAYVEMLETGFTRVGEFHYLHHDPDGRTYADPAEMAGRIAAAAEAAGIGLTLLPAFYAHSGFGGLALTDGQRRFAHGLEGFARLLEASRTTLRRLDGAVLGLAAHSLRAVTPEELGRLADLAGDGPIHIHIAEQAQEVEDCLAWSGARPVDWLLDHADVDARWCLVHATHMTPQETARLAASGAVAGLCPVTEANLGDGLFPAEGFLDAGGRFGVGSDSNVLIGAAEELRTLEYGQRLVRRGRNLLAGGAGRSTGADLFRGALSGGARALGALGADGGLTIGAPADIVCFDPAHPSLIGRQGDALLDSWIFAGRGVIDRVWRAGREVVSGGRHHARAAVEARYRAAVERLLT